MAVGNTVDEAVHLFVSLERHCKVQLLTEAASASGIQKTLIDPEDAAYSGKLIQNPHVAYVNVCCRFWSTGFLLYLFVLAVPERIRPSGGRDERRIFAVNSGRFCFVYSVL
jgi:hypothetical protein